MRSLEKFKVNKVEDFAIKISKNINSSNKKWKIYLRNSNSIYQDYIVICSAMNTQKLLKPLGHIINLEPILGQVVELELKKNLTNWEKLPAILNYQSINFIHHNCNYITMGATIENGTKPSLSNKQEMLKMSNCCPEWIKEAKIREEWHGIRARPINEPSPLLKELEPGLFINTGHYRNGILLAPSCAEWIGLKIENE